MKRDEFRYGSWTLLWVAGALILCSGTVTMVSAAGSKEAVGDCATLVASSSLPPLHTLSPVELDSVLGRLRAAEPSFAARLRALALARLGAPYRLGTLGEESAADPDPVFRVDEADCTVLVLTTVAMAHARDAAAARHWMGPANYRQQGDTFPVEYENRLHFTADRLTGSPLFVDLTCQVAAPGERKSVHVILNRKADGEELLPLGWERELTLDYVPAAHLRAVLQRVPATCGIAFVREANVAKGLLVSHEGFLLDGRCLLHASSENGKVALVDILDYFFRPGDPDPALAGRARFDGVLIYDCVESDR